MQGMSDDVSAVACHPSQPLLAIACSNGVLQVWNYEMKLLMILREFNSASVAKDQDKKAMTLKSRNQLRPSCIAFDSSGGILATGFSSGIIKLLYTDNLEDMHTYAPSSESIEKLCFSASGKYLAAYDSGRHVLLFRIGERPSTSEQQGHLNSTDKREVGTPNSGGYVYIGRALAHSAPITGLIFGEKDGADTLVSVSEDQYCVEYDLVSSTVATGVKCMKNENNGNTSHRLEFDAKPTAIMWQPHFGVEEVEDRFVVANDAFKFREFNVQSMESRKTSLAPRFGSPVNNLVLIPATAHDSAAVEQQSAENSAKLSKVFAFATPYRVIGLSTFPLTGDPSQTTGIVAHPAEITSIAVSYDGKYLFSAGGSDLSANMWKIDLAPSPSNPEGELTPYYTLLEGGEGGDLHRDIVDYFYYCQLRHLGEDSMEQRNLSGVIPLEEIPSLFRSVGYYPSEEDVKNIISEVRFKDFMVTGETEDFIRLDELIKLYINYRPALPLDKQLISAAFQTICGRLSDEQDTVDWETILHCLTNEGEKVTMADLDAFLVALTGNDSKSIDYSETYDAKKFAEKLLGFEDF